MPSELPGEIKPAVEKLVGGFNNKNHALYNSAFAEDAVVIDGIAPYRWTGSNAPARWLSDAEKWLHDFNVEKETLVFDKVLHSAVVGTYAYVVISATLFLKLKGGETPSRPGILTLTFARQGDEWKIGSQTWGRLS
jgi:ketosteroid isomerase-like protein